MKLMNSSLKGFTLIEMMIVVAVIGLIIGIGLPNILAVQERSRDEEAIAQIGVIEQSLAQYRQKCKTYPLHTSAGKIDVNASTGIVGINNGKCNNNITLKDLLPQKTIDFITDNNANISYTALSVKSNSGSSSANRSCSSYYLAYSLEGTSSTAKQSERSTAANSTNLGFVKCRTQYDTFVFPDPAQTQNLYIAPVPSPF